MSLKNILGLSETGLTDYEIMAKIREAQKRNLNEIDFMGVDGSVIKVLVPLVPNFDIYMDLGS